jgi:hypothetical protein
LELSTHPIGLFPAEREDDPMWKDRVEHAKDIWAISQEDCITARQAEKKRKTHVVGPSAQPQRFRIVSNTQNRGPQQQQGRWVIRP